MISTLKQRQWLKVYLACGNATEAAMQTYDCKDRDSASQIGYENLRKLEFTEVLEESGLTDAKLVGALKEGLEADKIKVSFTEPDRIIPDYLTRHRYLVTALKLKGRLSDKGNIEATGNPIPILGMGARVTTYGENDPLEQGV